MPPLPIGLLSRPQQMRPPVARQNSQAGSEREETAANALLNSRGDDEMRNMPYDRRSEKGVAFTGEKVFSGN